MDVPIDPMRLGCCSATAALPRKTTPSFTTTDPELAQALEDGLDDVELREKSLVTT